MKARYLAIGLLALAGCSSSQAPVTPQSLIASVCAQQPAVVQNAPALATPGQTTTILSILCGAQIPATAKIPESPVVPAPATK